MIGRIGEARPAAPRHEIPRPPVARVRRSSVAAGEDAPTGAWPNGARVARLVGDLEAQRIRIDDAIARASRGDAFSPVELVALQAQVYRYSVEIEVVSRVVDRSVGAVKTLANTQV